MTLEGYGSGTHMHGLLEEFWERQKVITWKNRYHGPHFKETRETTQGYLISPTLFNLIIENMVHNCLVFIVEEKLFAHEGLGLTVGQCLGLFYTNNSMVGSRYPEWLQGALNVLIILLKRYGLVTNVDKYKAMMCQPG